MSCSVLNYSFLLNGSTNIISYTYHLGTTKNTFAAPKSENRILNIKMLGGFLKNLRKTGKSKMKNRKCDVLSLYSIC